MELSSISIAITSLVGALFSPGAMFTTGVNGAWYDPSDITTLFQDAAGTTPVTAVGQPVGRILDKSGRGNHAFNPSGNSANFPVLSARYNLATETEFQNGLTDAPIRGGLVSASTLTGYLGAIAFGYDGATISYAYKGQTFTGSTAYKLSVDVQMTDGSAPLFQSSSTSNEANDFIFVVSGDVQNPLTYTTTSLGNGVYRVAVVFTTQASPPLAHWGVIKYGTNSSRTFKVTAYDLRVANDALNQPAYQRVNTATDYDTVGFKPYLSFNGVNQWLQTNSIDFTYGDKMFVCAGFRALNPSMYQAATELSASFSSNAGGFVVFKNGSNAQSWYFGSSGTAVQLVEKTGYPEPITNVVSGIGNISGRQAILRVNGAQEASSTSDQGTGNYGNYPLYIGARAGTSLFFNGRLYGLVIAGKQARTVEIASTERYLNQKTGAY